MLVEATEEKPGNTFNYLLNVGTASTKLKGRSTLIISNNSLQPGTHFVLVFPDKPQKISEAIILRKTKLPPMAEPEQFAYTINPVSSIPEDAALAIAILASKSKFVINQGRVYANLEGNGFKETFRMAYSTEGAHLTVWNGPPLTGKRKWHDYFYLGYDTEPNCTSKDY